MNNKLRKEDLEKQQLKLQAQFFYLQQLYWHWFMLECMLLLLKKSKQYQRKHKRQALKKHGFFAHKEYEFQEMNYNHKRYSV